MEVLKQEQFEIIVSNDPLLMKVLKLNISKYTDSRSEFIKQMLRHTLFHFHFHSDDPTSVLKLQPWRMDIGRLKEDDEELIAEMAYLLQEYTYGANDVVHNKDEQLEGIIFVSSGLLFVEQIVVKVSKEILIEKLRKRSTYGFHLVANHLMKVEKGMNPPKSQFYLTAKEDSVLLLLKIEDLRKMTQRSPALRQVFKKALSDAKAANPHRGVPDCDFTTHLTYDRKLSIDQLRAKLKRACMRQIGLNRYDSLIRKVNFIDSINELIDISEGQKVDQNDRDIRPIDLTQLAQKETERKLYNLLSENEIMSDVEVIYMQQQNQNKLIQSINHHLRGQLYDYQ